MIVGMVEVLKRLVVGLFLLGILVVSLGLVITGVADIVASRELARDVGRFVATPCVRLDARALRHHSKRTDVFAPQLLCTYRVAGRDYQVDSHFVNLGRWFDTADQAVGAAELHRSTMDRAFYDPAAPARAVLSLDISYDHWDWGQIALGAFVPILVGAAFATSGIRKLRARRVRDALAVEPIPTARIIGS